MKELNLETKPKLEISVKKQQEIAYELIGHIVPHDGHIMWEISHETEDIQAAKYQNTTYILGEEIKKEILTKPNHSYISALNKTNALKKYRKGENGSKQINQNPLSL